MTTTTDKPTAAPSIDLHPAVCMPKDFAFDAVPERPKIIPHRIVEGAPALGPLQAFQGDFVGRGFNTIFRPQNKATPTALPVPQPDSNNVLELNLTAETLSFSQSLGAVPNRGEAQGDIALNGVSYLQTITDVTDPKISTSIHFEPGLWMIAPPTAHPQETDSTLFRLGSIPHGTTINAQGTFLTVAGGPKIDPIDITPFKIGDNTARIRFPSQTATDIKTARIPQDLSIVPSITQELLDDPTTLLRSQINGLNIVSTDVILVDTQSKKISGGGTDNINFLNGDDQGPNASAVEMSATFWIETVQAVIELGPAEADVAQLVRAAVPANAPAPVFSVTSASTIEKNQSITVTFTQIQYSQVVLLNFAHLSWPHVSVATLVPSTPIDVRL
jgi:hypothetical protein